MASIESRDKGYCVRWREGRAHRSRKFSTMPEAIAFLENLQTKEPSGPGAQPVVTLRDLFEAWLRAEAQRLRPRTLAAYAVGCDLCVEFGAETKRNQMTDLSRPFLDEFRTWLAQAENARHGKPRLPATIGKLVQIVEVAWEWAANSDRWPDVPPPRKLKHPISYSRPTAPTIGEVDRMIAKLRPAGAKAKKGTAPDWILRLAVLARYTGERRSALLALRWDDVQFDEAALIIEGDITKGGYGGRRVPIHPDLLARLARWPRIGPTLVAAPELEVGGRGHCDRYLRRAWTEAEVPASRWKGQPLHSARKALRTFLVVQGVQADIIDAIIGHAGTGLGGRTYTDRGHLFPRMREAIALLPALAPHLHPEQP